MWSSQREWMGIHVKQGVCMCVCVCVCLCVCVCVFVCVCGVCVCVCVCVRVCVCIVWRALSSLSLLCAALSPLWSVVCGSSWGFQSGRRSDVPPYARWPSSRGSHPSSLSAVCISSGTYPGCQRTGYQSSFLCLPLLGGKRTAGGQKRRWSDLVSNDLKQCNLSRSWREQAQERDSWRATIRRRVELLNKQAEDKQKACKDEQKRRRQQHLLVSESALHCNHPGCSFQARNQAGLTNHQRQRHFTIQTIQCQYCHQAFHQQGLHNHQHFCQSRPPAT